jgi:hypothetical protein
VRPQVDTAERGHTQVSKMPEQGLAGKEGVIGMEQLEILMILEKDISVNEKMIEELTTEKKEEIKRLQNEIQALIQPYQDNIQNNAAEISRIRQNILETWSEAWGKQFKDEQTRIILTRKTRETPEIHDEKSLLTQAITFDEMPIKKISWDNSKLKTLITAGVIKKDIASMTETFELSVTYPKED